MKNSLRMSRNNYCTTGNFLVHSYHQIYYKLISIDLSKQTNTTVPQQISFTEKLEENDGATLIFMLKSRKSFFKLFFRFIK